jgi:hypothetical protein
MRASQKKGFLKAPFRTTDIIFIGPTPLSRLEIAEREFMKRRNIDKWFIAFFVLASSDYAMSKRPQEKMTSEEEKPVIVSMGEKKGVDGSLTYLDTLNKGKEIGLSDNDLKPILPESTAIVEEKDGKGSPGDGFRVQCFASSQIERIRSEQKQLESKVKFPVYVVFNAPYYKLLVGDFAKRGEADAALVKLKEFGFPDAWVARCRINTGR